MDDFKNFFNKSIISDQEAENFASMTCKDVNKYLTDKSGSTFGSYAARSAIVKKYAWTIPCKEYIDLIKECMLKNEPLYDLMAGSGFVAKVLRKHGIQVKSFEKHLVDNPYGHIPEHDPEMEERDAVDVVREFQKPTNVLLSWIPYEDPVGEQIIELLPVGSVLFLVGEGSGGATGTYKLWDIIDDKFSLIKKIHIPQWRGIHDQIAAFYKKS